MRTVTGRADVPRIHLRYTLEVPGQAPRAGEERLVELNYLGGTSTVHRSEPLYFEKKLLEKWMRERFVGP